LVAYACPQCGASVEIPPGKGAVHCSYCDAAIRVEGRRPETTRKAPARSRDWTPWEPPREATLNEYTFGRFELTILRQVFHDTQREAMRWVPLGDRHAGLFLLRVFTEEKGRRKPGCEPLVLDALARAAEAKLRERRDPGLAVKAALQALTDSGAPGELEAFAAVFDADLSRVVACNAGCPSALIHCSVEEARPIDVTRSGRPLKPVALRGKQDVFKTQRPVELASGDAVVVISAAFGGEGRGWPTGPGSTFRALREVFPGPDSGELALAVKDRFWEERSRTPSGCRDAPVGDLLVASIRVRSNVELRGQDTGPLPALKAFTTDDFEVTLAPSGEAYLEWIPLHSQRHALVWLEGVEAGGAQAKAVRDAVVALLDGQTGDNWNARRAGREGFEAAGIDDAQVRALIVVLGDEHHKMAFWTRGWPPACHLRGRDDRSTLQAYDEGGEMWFKPGARALFMGGLPLVGDPPLRDDVIPSAWPGGKASALYELCRQHEDLAGSDDFLQAAMRAARVDAPGAELLGLATVVRTDEGD
jgi:DNA-directed RNA polymerase subunit RPC12/RpoP